MEIGLVIEPGFSQKVKRFPGNLVTKKRQMNYFQIIFWKFLNDLEELLSGLNF